MGEISFIGRTKPFKLGQLANLDFRIDRSVLLCTDIYLLHSQTYNFKKKSTLKHLHSNLVSPAPGGYPETNSDALDFFGSGGNKK